MAVPDAGDVRVDEIEELARRPELWGDARPQQLLLLATTQGVMYGRTSHEDWFERWRQVYRVVVRRVPAHQRMQMLNYLVDRLETEPGACALLRGIAVEDVDSQVVSSAALNAAIWAEPGDEGELEGAVTLRRIAEDEDLPSSTGAGILAGVLLLGDRRLLPVLDGCWRSLDDAGKQALAGAKSGFAYASQIEFYLRWLDDCIATGEDGTFGLVAAALASIPAYADRVTDVRRKIPVWADTDQPPVALLHEWTIAEYGRRIAPRLTDLYARESEPKILDRVFRHWGMNGPVVGAGGSDSIDDVSALGLPATGNARLDGILRAMVERAAETGACAFCGGPLEPGFGTQCASCHDRALADIATTMGVRGIWSEEWENDYPAAGHPIWGVLERTLNRKQAGESVEDIYQILDELDLYETLRVIDTPAGQVSIERVDLPHASGNRVWLIRWNQRSDSVFMTALDGDDRHQQAAELAMSFPGHPG